MDGIWGSHDTMPPQPTDDQPVNPTTHARTGWNEKGRHHGPFTTRRETLTLAPDVCSAITRSRS